MRRIHHLTGLLTAMVLYPATETVAQITFVDRAPETGTTNLGFGRGAAMVDLDGDDLPDLISCNDGLPNVFFRQLPDHTFEEMNDAWQVAPDSRATWGVLATDFDNDGDADVYFINGGFYDSQANQVLRNDLNVGGVFTDVSAFSGDGAIVAGNFGGTALDYDLDGDLDIFLTDTREAGEGRPCILLRNDGGLVFTDVSAGAGVVDAGDYLHCSSGDYNNDGWIDVAVGNIAGPNRLYRNNGDGTFVDVAAFAGIASPDANFGLVLEDFDNDGWLDAFIPKYYPQAQPPGTSELYRNNGDGTFTNVTPGSGMTGQTDMGHNTGDLDADGFPDLYIGTGHPSFPDYDLLFLVTPDGSGGFTATDVSDSSGITANGQTRCHGMAIGDYDQDGFVDVYANNGGPQQYPDTMELNALWQSQGNANPWTAVRLTGLVSNRFAVGARCLATTDSGRQVRRYLRAGNGFANTDSPIQHFGIGQDQTVVRIEITWPSGITQTILNPPMYQVSDVTEYILRGDVNGDAVVSLEDIPGFVAVLLGLETDPYRVAAADMDASGIADGGDTQLFVDALLQR